MYDDKSFSDSLVETMVILLQARDAVAKALDAELAEIGLSYIQAYVLVALKMSNRPLSVSEVAHFLFREIHSTSALVTRMERCGYVEKLPDADDKRCVQIRLTSKGVESADEVAKRTLGLYGYLLSFLADEQLKQLKECLRGVRNRAVEGMGFQIAELPPHMSMERLNEWLSQIRCRQDSLSLSR